MGSKEKSASVAVRFAAPDVDLIMQSLPNGVAQKRLESLPKILSEWDRAELPRHLSLESLKIIREREKNVEVFEKQAHALLQAFNALDEAGLRRIEARMPACKTPGVSQTELSSKKQELVALRNFLTRLASAEPHASQKLKRGHPRNYVAYLVILDIAAIFEWLTKTEASREVDRGGNGDIGPFWEFAESIWPLIFDKRKFGLSSALKNWASVKSAWKRGRQLATAFRHCRPCRRCVAKTRPRCS